MFDLLDYLTSNILLPIGGLAIALFAGWAIPDRMLIEELGLSPAGGRVLRVNIALRRSGGDCGDRGLGCILVALNRRLGRCLGPFASPNHLIRLEQD